MSFSRAVLLNSCFLNFFSSVTYLRKGFAVLTLPSPSHPLLRKNKSFSSNSQKIVLLFGIDFWNKIPLIRSGIRFLSLCPGYATGSSSFARISIKFSFSMRTLKRFDLFLHFYFLFWFSTLCDLMWNVFFIVNFVKKIWWILFDSSVFRIRFKWLKNYVLSSAHYAHKLLSWSMLYMLG